VASLLGPEAVASRSFALKVWTVAVLYRRPVMSAPQPNPDDPCGDGDPPGKAGDGSLRPRRRRRRGLSRDDLTMAEVGARLRLTRGRRRCW
jgi:hypothetical protein